jgi:acyl carrier protein
METEMADGDEAVVPREITERIRKFVLAQFPTARQLGSDDGASLLESGVVDSLGILELVNFVAEEFGVEASDEDLTPENFDSIRSLGAFVDRKRSGGA